MATREINISKILPVLMAFFVMSFVDLVGIGVDRVSKDMSLSATVAQLIPSAAFLWFFILSVPVGVLQSRLGKKTMLNIGMGVTALGLLVPFFMYSFAMVLFGFALLGIGNTIVQVSANPLLVDVVPGNRASSFLSFSQFIKAVGSMLGAPLAGFFAAKFGDWKLLFLVFGIVSILAVLWLGTSKITETRVEGYKATFGSSFKLLGNNFVLLMVLSIFVVVGVDVGFNSNSGQFLIKQFGIEQTAAESGRSVYFFGRMLGTFAGAIMLTRISSRSFFMWTSILGILCLAAILLVKSGAVAWILIFFIGLAIANIWPLVFSIAVEKHPLQNNEISGLMMMAISGGAVIPLLIGWISDMSNISWGMSVLIICMIYLLAVSIYCLKTR
ncbi:MAG: MFS transporter [Bacteroidales bacterium]|nr:MFS transporter [Bacteroidales bacterium]HPM18951.1 MFS transporter [Bacteroidales bacterium]HQG78278.1 MFS transporter [Bacteroidales bacterium]